MVKVSASVRERQLEKEREKQARAAREAAIVVENFPIVIGDAAQKKQEVLL